MRRSHIGIGGWRNENSRTFRPRIGGNPHFRPARIYETLERPRFPPPGSRSIRLQHFNVRSEKSSDRTSDHSDKYRYRSNQNHAYQRSQQDHQRQPPMGQWSRHRSDSHRNTSKDSFNYYEDLNADRFHINSMGDVDHRQIQQARGIYRPPLISPWADQPLQHPTEKNFNTSYRQDRSQNKQPGVSIDYTGHRPPASDHYGCNPTAGIENSHSFSRSVDDTVDIVRKRLLNRDRQNSTENLDNCQNNTMNDNQKIETITNFQSNRNEVPTRKKSHRQHLTDTTNCAKIKNKIVHQLFKMDKEKIHKLMDNPNSSSKFEYAISSLITESQNSFNRHLRSAAEKSLCDSSTEFIENDNNTIYEDTFMKQMQCILDPQDTVFLEDIKPFVMAELTKVLQLNEYGQHYNRGDGEGTTSDRPEEQLNYIPYPNDFYDQEDITPVNNYLVPHNTLQTDYPRSKSVEPTIDNYKAYEDNQSHYEESKPLFERRCRTKSFNFTPNISNSETPFYGRNAESKPIEDFTRTEGTQDLFDTNAEQFSEEEDPFAELDKQYHVAVDPDFIDHDDISSPKQEINTYNSNYTKDFKAEPLSPENIFERTSDKDTDAQLQDTIKSSLNISSSSHNISTFKKESKDTIIQCNQEQLSSTLFLPLEENNGIDINNANENIEKQSESKEVIKQIAKTDNSTSLKTTSSNSRKRSIDQRPSHRKEKRKKADPNASESSKQILNKNIIINVNDCASKTSEKCEASKSIFNLFFSKEETRPVPKDNKNTSVNDKNHVEKHVKRKETPKKSSQKDIKIKRKDSISSNQPTSPTDNNNISNNDETPTKSDMKITLKPIDMFVEQPKKVNIHQAHRNTAPILTPNIEINKKSKVKGPLSRQTLKRHVAVQVIRKVHAKQTQTPVSKCCGAQSCLPTQKTYAVKAVQTDVNIPEKTGNKSNDAFERMKEIDLEIQVLLQEKFKLYSSIENKETGTNSMQTLGMTVLNVSPYNGEGENESTEDMLSEDAIVNDFANIPVEELEQLALESVEGHEVGTSSDKKRNLRRKVSCQDSTTKSPITVPKKKNQKPKSPNISLIEQIIEDDRPLEDIISLDDLEIPETKTKKRKQRPKQITKKKAKSKSKAALSSSIDYKIKECSVIIVRTDINQYLKPTLDVKPDHDIHIQDENFVVYESSQSSQRDVTFTVDVIFEKNEENIVEETVVDDIQFDMLDVSEDIVVGESCEIKSLEDKEVIENVCEPVSEEIILDNSQSSIEETCTPAVGQCDECKVYDYAADENLRRDSVVVSGNADAVLAIECVENNFLAACLDGNVYYFNGDGQLLTTLRGSNLAVTCLTIVKEKYGTTVYTGSLDSRIRYYDLETGLEKGPECNVLSPIQTMDRAWDTVFVGTRTGFVLQFECKNNMLIPVSSVKFSDQSILALRAMKEGPRKVLLVAARSENVTIKDAQTGLLLRTLVGPKMTVYTLLYEDGKVYCGTSSHQIHVFDYTSGSHVGTHEGGKGAVCLRATGGLLFAGCYDGCVYVYREGEGQPFAQIRGPSLMLLSLAVVGSKIIAGYKDRSLYIWKIPLCILQEMIL